MASTVEAERSRTMLVPAWWPVVTMISISGVRTVPFTLWIALGVTLTSIIHTPYFKSLFTNHCPLLLFLSNELVSILFAGIMNNTSYISPSDSSHIERSQV